MAIPCGLNMFQECDKLPAKVYLGKVVGRISDITEDKNGFTFLFGEHKQKVLVTNSKKPNFMKNGIFVELDMDENTISYKPERLNEYSLIKRGFQSKPHLVLGKLFLIDVGRNREISVSCIGTPNEMIFLNEYEGFKQTCIPIHNYDYDGFLTEQKLDALISVFKQPE